YYKEARQTISNVMKRLDQHTAHKKIGDIFVIEEKIESAIVSYTAALMERDDTALRTKLAKIYYVSADNHFKQGEKETAKKEFFKAYRLTKTGKIAEDSLIKIGFMHIDEGELVKLRKTVTMLKDSFPYSNGPLTLYVEGGKQMIAKGLILAGAGLFEEAGTVARSVTEAQKLIFKAVETLSEAELYNDALLVLNRAIEGETLTKDGLAEAMYLVGTILIDSGKDGEGKEMLKKLVFKTEKPKGKERTFIARARLALLKDNLDKYNSVKIAPPFKSTMRLKEKLLKELINEYTFILKSKVSDIQAETLYMMGLTFEEFHNALITSEKPEGLTEEELMEYNFLLEEKAFKFEDNSIRSYESAIKAARLNSQGGTLHLAIQRLERLRPVLYKRAFSADATNIQPPLRIAIQSRTDARMAGLEGFRFTRKIYPRTNETKASRKHFKQGLKLIKDNPAQAMKKFRAAVSVQPDNVEAIYNLSLLQYRSGNYAGAMTELRKLTEMNVSSVDVLEMHSRMHIKANKIDEAFAMLDKAMLMKRRHTTLTSLAILHEQSGNKNKAEQLYIVLSTMEPEDPFIAYNYGILLLQNGNFAEAEEKLQKALPLKTKYPQIVSAYAKVMAASGRTTEAINMYKEAIKAEPKNPSPNKDIGIIYEIYLRDFTNALIYYKKYIDLNGRDKKEVELWIGLIKEMTGR
ncbi:MAG: tetratricopeptide repeat protein, partial [Deltaproteobacteria bacterium]|nr:tetratricopeptide repeat protein [Deltaproteobacteria bacterium]